MKKLLLILIGILFVGCTKTITYNSYKTDIDYISMFGSINERNFFIQKKVTPNLKFNWNSSAFGSFSNTSMSAYDSLLIVPDLGGRITSFNIYNGKKIGQLKYNGEIEQAVLINNGRLYFIINDAKEKYSTFVVYDFSEGDEIKTIELNGRYNNELILGEKNIIAVSNYGNISNIKDDVEINWQIEIDKNIYTNPTSDEKNLYLATSDGILYSINLKSGAIIFKKKISNGFQSGITLEGNNLYLGDDDGNLFSINKNNGETNWEFPSNYKIVSTPSLDDQNIYFGNLNGDFYSLNKNNGQINWSNSLGGLINSSALIFENVLVQLNLQKHLDLIDKENGELIQQIEFDGRCRSTPIYFKDKLFFGVDKGEVYCYSFDK